MILYKFRKIMCMKITIFVCGISETANLFSIHVDLRISREISLRTTVLDLVSMST